MDLDLELEYLLSAPARQMKRTNSLSDVFGRLDTGVPVMMPRLGHLHVLPVIRMSEWLGVMGMMSC